MIRFSVIAFICICISGCMVVKSPEYKKGMWSTTNELLFVAGFAPNDSEAKLGEKSIGRVRLVTNWVGTVAYNLGSLFGTIPSLGIFPAVNYWEAISNSATCDSKYVQYKEGTRPQGDSIPVVFVPGSAPAPTIMGCPGR